MASTYAEQLRHPEWQRKRLEILDRAGFSCEQCGSIDRTLHVHHSYYERGLKPWDYPDSSLHALCEVCHDLAQRTLLILHRVIGRLSLDEIEFVLGCAIAVAFYRDDTGEDFPIPIARDARINLGHRVVFRDAIQIGNDVTEPVL